MALMLSYVLLSLILQNVINIIFYYRNNWGPILSLMTGQIRTAGLILDTRQIKIIMTGGGGAHTTFFHGPH